MLLFTEYSTGIQEAENTEEYGLERKVHTGTHDSLPRWPWDIGPPLYPGCGAPPSPFTVPPRTSCGESEGRDSRTPEELCAASSVKAST